MRSMASLSCAFGFAARWVRPRKARAATASAVQPGRLAQGPEENSGRSGLVTGFAGAATTAACGSLMGELRGQGDVPECAPLALIGDAPGDGLGDLVVAAKGEGPILWRSRRQRRGKEAGCRKPARPPRSLAARLAASGAARADLGRVVPRGRDGAARVRAALDRGGADRDRRGDPRGPGVRHRRWAAADGTVRGRRIWLHCVGMGVFSNALPFALLSWAQDR